MMQSTVVVSDKHIAGLLAANRDEYGSAPFEAFAEYFLRYLSAPLLPTYSEEECLYDWLPRVVVQAIECLIMGKKPQDRDTRLALADTMVLESVPSLVGLHYYGAGQRRFRAEVLRMPRVLYGDVHSATVEILQRRLEELFLVEERAFAQALDRFYAQVYVRLYESLIRQPFERKVFRFGPAQLVVRVEKDQIDLEFERRKEFALVRCRAQGKERKNLLLVESQAKLYNALFLLEHVISEWPL